MTLHRKGSARHTIYIVGTEPLGKTGDVLKSVRQTVTMPDMPRDLTNPMPRPGQLLARGVCRHLLDRDFVTVEEMTPAPGLRVDVMAMGPKGEIWVVECKSSRADFTSDRKWQGYLDWCDRYFWAVDAEFPVDLLSDGTGLIVADAYDAEIVRMPPEVPLAAARRKVVLRKFARHAALRWQAMRDPGFSVSRA